MGKFLTLLNKEVRELLTIQMILPMIVTLVLFGAIGKLMSSESKKASVAQPVTVIDQDQSVISQQLIKSLRLSNFEVTVETKSSVDALLKNNTKAKAILVIPENFSRSVADGQVAPIKTYTMIHGFSVVGNQSALTVQAALQAFNEYLGSQIISSKLNQANPSSFTSVEEVLKLKNPVVSQDIMVVNGRQAEGNISQIISFLSQQTYFVPIILFLVIILAAQMIATSMASEKENKTLETLLSLPVKRQSIVAAKLIGAGVVALLLAVVYMIGMRYYINGLTDTTSSITNSTLGASATPVAETIKALGLTFSGVGYVLLGITLFSGILCALAIAMILGSFVEDIKSVQGVISPLMVLVVIPYFLTMLTDFGSLSPSIQWAVYAIPFSHPFLAIQQLLLHNYQPVLYGILYQWVVIVVFILLAGRIFSSDRILTMRLHFSKKSLFRR